MLHEGDFVRVNHYYMEKRGAYGVTNERMIVGKILKILTEDGVYDENDDCVFLQVVSHIDVRRIGDKYWVCPKYFSPIDIMKFNGERVNVTRPFPRIELDF